MAAIEENYHVSVLNFIRQNPRLSLVYLTGLFFIYSLSWRIYLAFFSPLSKFPGPKFRAVSKIPMIRHMFSGTETAAIRSLHEKYGPIVRTSPTYLSFVGSAETWRMFYGFGRPGQNQPSLANNKDWHWYGQGVNNVRVLINAFDEDHARQRRIVSHAFSDKALREQEPMLKMWAGKLRRKLAETEGKKVDMLKMWNCTTFDIMADLTFAEPLYMLDESEYTPWVKTIFASLKQLTQIRAVRIGSTIGSVLVDWVLPQIPALKRIMIEHQRYTNDRVDRRMSILPERPDLWTRILEKSGLPPGEVDAAMLNEKIDTSGGGLSLDEHYITASLFMIGGTETTATALSGTIYYLLRNPRYMKALQRELRGAFGDGGGKGKDGVEEMHLDALTRLPLLDAVLKEGLRMYPPVPIGMPRTVPAGGITVDFDDRKVFIPGGTSVAISNLSTCYAESNFARPYEYRPERWLNAETAATVLSDLGNTVMEEFANDDQDSMEVFSTGPRGCLGKNLAWLEMRLLLASVLTKFDMELCKESEDWADQKVFTVWEKRELMVKLKEVNVAS